MASIATMAANIKQRQRVRDMRLNDSLNPPLNAEICKEKFICKCGFEAFYNFVRCPSCNELK